MTGSPAPEETSSNRFALELADQPRIEPVPPEVWDEATPLPAPDYSPGAVQERDLAAKSGEYRGVIPWRGRTYSPSGRTHILARTVVPLTDRPWLVTQTVNAGWFQPPNIDGHIIPDYSAQHGTGYIDMFSTLSGKKLFTVILAFRGGIDLSAAHTRWLTDRWLYIPGDYNNRSLVVCRVPDSP